MFKTMLIAVILGALGTAAPALGGGTSTVAEDAQLDYARQCLATTGKTAEIRLKADLGHREAFRVVEEDGRQVIESASPAGAIYGAMAVAKNEATPGEIEKPDFDIRGTTLCLMSWSNNGYKATLSPQIYPWFYDKPFMTRTLDAFAAARMNTIFVWGAHLFPYLVDMPKYPEASADVPPQQVKANQEQFLWFTREAQRRNMRVLLHFYNIHVSPPFAAKHGIPPNPSEPTPLLEEYMRYALGRYFQTFPAVGLYVCPGESLATGRQLEWFRDVIFAAAKKSGKDPLIVIRDWTLDMNLKTRIKDLYENCYSELKHNDESLTSPVPDRRHQQWKGMTKGHVVNLHGPPMDLQPMRWGSPLFVQETVAEWKRLGFLKGAEIYTVSFWQWPYTLDKLEPQQQGYKPAGRKLLWLDRSGIYLDEFGRYLWKVDRQPGAEQRYWQRYLAAKYGSEAVGRELYRWYVLSGPLSPGMQNLTATRFGNFWPTPMLQHQGVDTILQSRRRLDDVPITLTRVAGHTEAIYYSQPMDVYFIERYKTKYNLPALAERLSMPVAQYAAELAGGRTVTSAMTPDKVCDLLCDLAKESLAAAKAAEAAAGLAEKEELGRFVTDSQMYVLATEALRHKVQAAILKQRMILDPKAKLGAEFLRQMEQSVEVYQKLAELTSATYLYGNDLNASHWQREGIKEFKDDLAKQKKWLSSIQ